jgi:hypothetical protein
MNFSPKPLPLLILLFLSFNVLAQKPPIKLGDVSAEEVEMKVYEQDPDADAVVLCDYGYLSFSFDMNKGQWENQLQRICRIKIFNDDGYKWATQQVSLYDDNDTEQSIAQIKGYTYNMENGKVKETKLGKDNIFNEEATENYSKVKFTMPNVKEGSVIEFSYTVRSNYLTILDKWQFQKSIPVKHSEYIVCIPEYLTYIKNSQGFEPFYSYETDSRSRNISWTESTRADINVRASRSGTMSTQKIDYRDNIYHWVAKDLKGMKDENFVGNYRNYLLGVDFQLSNYQDFSKKNHPILSDWKQVTDKFLNSYDDFGNNMKKKSFYTEVTDAINTKYEDPAARCLAVYTYVSQYMKWNKKERFMPSQNIKKTHEDRTGSSADINALLVSMLRSVDIDADPVIISTIDNGLVHPIYPIIDRYNYLIVRAKIGDKYVLMDATEKDLPFGMLPYRCLNQRGYAISETNPGWVDLQPTAGRESITQCLLAMDDSGIMKGSVNCKNTGYSAVNIRNRISSAGEEKYIEDFKSNHTDWAIESIEIDAPEAVDQPVKEKIQLEVNKAAEAMGDLIYVTPVLIDKIEENPLKQDTRKFPIEFIIPMSYSYMLSLKIPEGYVVDELPESVLLATPDKTAGFKYAVQANGNNIQLVHTWKISESFYAPEKFGELKEFYAMLVAKQNEQIVLKKAAAN